MSNEKLELLKDTLINLFDKLAEDSRQDAISEAYLTLLHFQNAKRKAIYSSNHEIFDFDATEVLLKHLIQILEANIQIEN